MAKPQTEFKSADLGFRSHWGYFPVFVGGFNFIFLNFKALWGDTFRYFLFLEVF